jgi:ribonuclease P protein component
MDPIVGRLKRRPEFLKVAAARMKWVTPGLILQARQRTSPDQPDAAAAIRVGFTVSRKVGQATARNRARRRLRAAASEVLPRYARPGYDYVLIGRRETLERPYDKLLDDLRQAVLGVATRRDRPRASGGPTANAKGPKGPNEPD